MWFHLAWKSLIYYLSLHLNLTNLNLVNLFMFSSIAEGILPLGNIIVFKLQILVRFIFHSGMVQNSFSVTPKTLFFAIIFLVPLPLPLIIFTDILKVFSFPTLQININKLHSILQFYFGSILSSNYPITINSHHFYLHF